MAFALYSAASGDRTLEAGAKTRSSAKGWSMDIMGGEAASFAE
jgi:hypothetical protein